MNSGLRSLQTVAFVFLVFTNLEMKWIQRTVLITLLLCSSGVKASSFFVGYELGQMAFNDFQNFTGEVGYSFTDDSTIRFTFLNVALTESHLSSDFAGAIDGDDVEGLWQGGEFIYDYPFYKKFMLSGKVGYYDTEYSHRILDESVWRGSPTVGFALTYWEDNFLNIPNTYLRFSFSFRYYLNAIPETMLGDTRINDNSFELTPIFFVGYRFD